MHKYTRLKCIVASTAIFHCVVNFFLSPEFWLTITVFLFLLVERGTFCPTPRDMADPSLAVWTTKAISFYKSYAFFPLALCSIIFVVFAALLHIFKMDFVHVALYMRKLSKKLHSSLLRLRSVTSFNIFLESHFVNTQILHTYISEYFNFGIDLESVSSYMCVCDQLWIWHTNY